MRYLAIDYGLKRVGLAVCDPDESIVSPFCQLEARKNWPEGLIEQLQKIILEHQIEAIVVGLPLNMDDTEGEQAQLTRQFSKKLIQATGLPVHLQDERLSSAAADEMLAEHGMSRQKQKSRRDMLAACAILRDFLGQ